MRAGSVESRSTTAPAAQSADAPRARLARDRATPLVVGALAAMGLVIRLAIMLRPLSIVDRLFVPDDTYYTLTIARSIAHGHGPTVDGTTLTSGFQPLLGFVMVPVFWLTHSVDAALRIELALLILVDTATIVVLAWVAYRLAGNVAAIIAAGLWAISPTAVAMSLGGLETSLAMFLEISLVAGWIWANDRPSTLRWSAVGATAGLAVLARIDALALVALLVSVQLWRGQRRPLITAGAVWLAVVLPWWTWCTLELGTPLPTSGPAAYRLRTTDSFSDAAMSNAAGAVSGGPFQPWEWLRPRLVENAAWGVIVFWLLILVLLAITVWMLRGLGRTPEDRSLTSREHGASTLAATVPAFSACLLVFYAWYGVTYYFTRYLAPVALTAALVIAVGVARVMSGRRRWKRLALLCVAGLLAVPTAGAWRTDMRELTVRDIAPHLYDAATGYREGARRAVRMPPRGSVLGAWQSGAVGYFAQDRLTVVNLDGVVNPDAATRQNRGLAEYMRRRHIHWLADNPMAIAGLSFRLVALHPRPRTRRVAAIAPPGKLPAFDVVEIIWPNESRRAR